MNGEEIVRNDYKDCVKQGGSVADCSRGRDEDEKIWADQPKPWEWALTIGLILAVPMLVYGLPFGALLA